MIVQPKRPRQDGWVARLKAQQLLRGLYLFDEFFLSPKTLSSSKPNSPESAQDVTRQFNKGKIANLRMDAILCVGACVCASRV